MALADSPGFKTTSYIIHDPEKDCASLITLAISTLLNGGIIDARKLSCDSNAGYLVVYLNRKSSE